MNAVELKEKRNAFNLTQKQLGDLIGTTERTIGNYEKGKVIPKVKIKALNKLFGIEETDKPKSHIGHRLKQVITYYKMSSAKFSRTIGIYNNQTIRYIINGKSEPSFRVLYTISEKYTDIDMEWLISGKGRMLKEMRSLDVTLDQVMKYEIEKAVQPLQKQINELKRMVQK